MPAGKVTRLLPGAAYQLPVPGDFILTHEQAWTSRLIRFGEALRYRGARRQYAYWSHAALITDHQGGLVEALGAGVQAGNLSKYTGHDYVYVGTQLAELDRQEAANFGLACVGREYGYATIVSLAITCLVGGKFTFGLDGTEICSALVASALERGTVVWPCDPAGIMPAGLAEQYHVGPV